ncbi:Rqc2 family fibronectin-binding protein [Desertibacillus haloalkaliphilus]|uniref:Rqc2 family fibronectin-binding protein n=1 Tax=Desertibacillus haloalkaliphilus TaxID=1328930 RepID=UPI001C26AF43|nr:NFACT RNA binding domain-containing protein [Desertibacillus haloalkaliphilus]MBU8907071.1 NFACT family protein [Desertibacillus haloalkaliphilus]
MSFDGVVTKAVTTEIDQALTSGRISRVYQPYKTELVLAVRAHGKNQQLFLSANPSFARVHLTREKYANPKEPPMFCMLLRKHIEGSIIEKIDQVDMERIITIDLKGKDEIGDISYKQLIIEVMGRHSNIILVDKQTGNILDSIKHITPAVSSYRTVMPGQTYIAPPSQNKLDPLDTDKETFLKKIDFNQGKLDQQIVGAFSGISPMVAKEVLHRAGLANRESLSASFLEITELIRNHQFEPMMITSGQKEYFTVIPLSYVDGDRRRFTTVSELLDRFYYGKAERDRVKQQAYDLERFLRNELQKNKKKIKKLEKTLVDADKAEKFQRYGELLTANLYAVNRGDKEIEVIDYYDEAGRTISIALDPQKTPSENAQHYFRKYNKAKNSVAVVGEQIEKAKEEINYLDQLIQQMESASPKDIDEIREELAEGGYIRNRQKTKKKKKQDQKPQLERYVSTTGIEIFVGKNNKQNEYLTNRFARQDETWLHTKDIPGSHVLIRSLDVDEQTLFEAANLAAYFSKAKHSSSVPVDYTKIRHVKKPNGAKPGFVTYENQTTIYVTPEEDLIVKLRAY